MATNSEPFSLIECMRAIAPALTDAQISDLLKAIDRTLTRKPARKPKQAASFEPLTDAQRTSMTDADIHAYYKRTAHIEDVRRLFRFGSVDAMPFDLAEAFRELLRDSEGGLNRSQTHKRLWTLTARWGAIVLAREQAERPKGPSLADWSARAIAAGLKPNDTYNGRISGNWPPSLEQIEQAEKKSRVAA